MHYPEPVSLKYDMSKNADPKAVNTFRRLIALLYREIGVLCLNNHEQTAAKRRLDMRFFDGNRKTIAREVYRRTRKDEDLDSTSAELEQITGLSLQDLRRAFCDGHWANASGRYSFGGPNWCRIAEATISLGDAIRSGDESATTSVLSEIGDLKHNNGKIIDKFSQLD